MSWIKMRTELSEDPAVVRIAQAVELDVYAVVGRLHRVWSWADTHTADGSIEGVSAEWLDELIQSPGFAAAMIEAGWLKATRRGLQFPRFDRHNGQSAKARALAARRQQQSRSRHGANVTSRGERDKSATRGEKRREEEKRARPDDAAAAPAGGGQRSSSWAEETRLREGIA